MSGEACDTAHLAQVALVRHEREGAVLAFREQLEQLERALPQHHLVLHATRALSDSTPSKVHAREGLCTWFEGARAVAKR